MDSLVVSFSGRKSSGKSECANYLQKKKFIILNFADALKEVISKVLRITMYDLEIYKNRSNIVFTLNNEQYKELSIKLEIPYEDIYNVISHYETPNHISGTYTIRELLQIIGTDLIRKKNPDWHVQKLKQKIDLSSGNNYCIADTRFLNEKKFIESINGILFFIIRPDKNVDVSNHISETQLNWTHFSRNCISEYESLPLEDRTRLNNYIIVNNKIPIGMFNQVDYYLYNYLHPNLLLQTFDNNDNYKYREQLKSKLFLEINYKNAYLAGYIFLKNNIKDNLSPFIYENYKLWKCSNKRYPDIIDNDSKCCLNQEMKIYYIKAWLKGLYDSLRGL
jgi:hypothetical protein